MIRISRGPEMIFRDFSRFSEEWLRAAVVGFGSVTVSVCLSVTKLHMFGALVKVCAPPPRLSYSVQDRSMGATNDLDRRGERRTTIG